MFVFLFIFVLFCVMLLFVVLFCVVLVCLFVLFYFVLRLFSCLGVSFSSERLVVCCHEGTVPTSRSFYISACSLLCKHRRLWLCAFPCRRNEWENTSRSHTDAERERVSSRYNSIEWAPSRTFQLSSTGPFCLFFHVSKCFQEGLAALRWIVVHATIYR